MMYKLIGAAMIVLSCGGFGLSIAAAHKNEVRLLRSLLASISYMKCELQFRCTTLPELCRKTAVISSDCIGQFFLKLSEELESQICPDPRSCVIHALSRNKGLPKSVDDIVMTFADTLGAFDLKGQLEGLEHAAIQAEQAMEKLTFEQEKRLRSYKTLGLCAGAALAILLV